MINGRTGIGIVFSLFHFKSNGLWKRPVKLSIRFDKWQISFKYTDKLLTSKNRNLIIGNVSILRDFNCIYFIGIWTIYRTYVKMKYLSMKYLYIWAQNNKLFLKTLIRNRFLKMAAVSNVWLLDFQILIISQIWTYYVQ